MCGLHIWRLLATEKHKNTQLLSRELVGDRKKTKIHNCCHTGLSSGTVIIANKNGWEKTLNKHETKYTWQYGSDSITPVVFTV